MIIDITGIELTPGNKGIDCLGNGKNYNQYGKLIECCCDECDYMKCCIENTDYNECTYCHDLFCPRAKKIDTSRAKTSK